MSNSNSSNSSVRYKSLNFLGYPNYRIGDDGSVWSRARGSWKKMKPWSAGTHSTHYVVSLHNNNIRKIMYVHRLVLLAFVGPCPEGMECRHFPDRDTGNNRLENLQWSTPKDNSADKLVHGTSIRGDKHGQAKLTLEQVLSMKKEFHEGDTMTYLAKKYRVSIANVSFIINRKRWCYVE